MRTSRWLAIGVLLIAITVALAGCGSGSGGYNNNSGGTGGTSGSGSTGGTTGGTTGTADNTIVAKDFAFSPSTLDVSVGDTVTFTNEDSAAHDIEIDGQNLGRISNGESVTWTADAAGTFPYVCTIHPSMKGTIVVK